MAGPTNVYNIAKVRESDAINTSVTIPQDAAGKEIHIILEVQDKHPIAQLSDYRRLVIQVSS